MAATRDLLAAAAAELAAAGVGSPRVDAELLLAHVLGVTRSALITRDDVDPVATDAFAAAIGRRATREPLQHIVGAAPFRHLELAVGPGVFIPRPETELLVDAALDALNPGDRLVDLCAGSGALGLAVLDERPGVAVIAVEQDSAALEWLRRNAAGTGLEIVEGDVRDPNLLFAQYGQVEVVLSNPPYVPEAVAVDPEVLADPAVAVFAGADGLDLLPSVIARAAELLRLDGLLVVEHDESHEASIVALLARDGRWETATVHRDLTGRVRYTSVRRVEGAPDAPGGQPASAARTAG